MQPVLTISFDTSFTFFTVAWRRWGTRAFLLAMLISAGNGFTVTLCTWRRKVLTFLHTLRRFVDIPIRLIAALPRINLDAMLAPVLQSLHVGFVFARMRLVFSPTPRMRLVFSPTPEQYA